VTGATSQAEVCRPLIACLGARRRGDGELVLRLAGEVVAAGAVLGEGAHQAALVLLGVAVFQAVEEHVVHHLAVAEAVAAARLGQQVGRVGHRLHAAGDHDLVAAGKQQVVRQHGRLHAGAAHLVDRGAAGRQRQAGAERGLAGRRLALAGGQHAAHDHFLHLLGREAGALDRRLDRDAAELRRGEAGQVALESAQRGASDGNDDDGIGHELSCSVVKV
jgi:hypothetical protein